MVRVRVSAYSSGTANITLRASDQMLAPDLTQGTAGQTAPPLVDQCGGVDNGGLLRAFVTGVTSVVSTFVGWLNSLVYGQYNSTPPLLTSGQGAPLQQDPYANLQVNSGTHVTGEDQVHDTMKVEEQFNYAYITTATTTNIAGASYLHLIGTPPTASLTITIYDNTTNSGQVLWSYAHAASPTYGPYNVFFDCKLTTGLTVVTSAVCNVVVAWR
jgi:hypothetical protein